MSGLRETKLATTIEIPFATASGAEVNQANSRALGQDIARALVEYLKRLDAPAKRKLSLEGRALGKARAEPTGYGRNDAAF